MSGQAPETLTWRVRPWSRRPARAAALAATFGLVSFLVHVAFGSALFDVLALAGLFWATRAFWAPLGFTLAPEGVTITELGDRAFYAWDRFQSWDVADGELVLAGTREGRPERLAMPVLPAEEKGVETYLREKTALARADSH
jgi:hypothetical protein